MGRYASWEMVVGRYQSARTAVDAGYANSYFITGAEDEVDGYLATKYSVPFSPVPGVVRDLTIDIAYYKLIYAEKRADALKKYIDGRLKDILEGNLMLTASGATLSQVGLETSLVNDRHSSFGPDGELNWIPSSSWASQYEEDRGR